MPPIFKAFLAGLIALAPVAADAGIAFESMPVGCSWSTKYSDGRTLIETFVGGKSNTYMTQTVDKATPKKAVSRTIYDKNGRMIRKDWADGHWETFKPYSCFETLGACSYSYKNGDGNAFVIENNAKKSGKGFKVVAGPKGGAHYPDEYFELGRFNIMKMNKSSNYWAKLVGFSKCDAESS